VNQEDHDLLTKIDANLSNHMELVKAHVIDDKVRFEKLDADLGWVRKILYGCVGIVLFIEFMVKVAK